VLRRYANDEKRRAAARERQSCATIALEWVACNEAQHEEA